MKKRKKIIKKVLAVAALSSLLMISGCGTQEDKPKAKTSSADKEAVNSITETKLEKYQVDIKNSYVHGTSAFGFALKFDVKFNNMSPSYDAYVCNDMSSLVDKKIQEENSKNFNDFKEKNPDASEEELNEAYNSMYKTIYFMNMSYIAGESVEIEWAPYPTEENSSKYSSDEEFLKTGYMYLLLKEGENITGFMVFEFPVSVTDKGEYEQISYEKVNVLEAVTFEKTDGKYQNVSLDYVKSRVDNILENKQ